MRVLVAAGILLLTLMLPSQAQLLHDIHKNAGVACAACHKASPPAPVPNETCVGCHGTMREPRAGTQRKFPDPHSHPHLGPAEVPVCGECHKVHGVSQENCSTCHRAFRFNIK